MTKFKINDRVALKNFDDTPDPTGYIVGWAVVENDPNYVIIRLNDKFRGYINSSKSSLFISAIVANTSNCYEVIRDKND
jgi:hypothetical protein